MYCGGGHLGFPIIKNIKFVEDHNEHLIGFRGEKGHFPLGSMIIPEQFVEDLPMINLVSSPSGFREEAF